MEINATLLGQAITFAILVWFTMKFVWPPLNKMLEDRAKQISDGLMAAEKGKKELQEAEARIAQELKNVQVSATDIMANAEKRANQIISAAKEQANKESEKILHDAKVQIEQEFVLAKEQLRNHVATLAISAAEQILKVEIDSSHHEKLLNAIKMEL